MSSEFEIHPRLRQDCHLLGRFELCRVLLHRNAALPWFILVPETDVADLLDLAPAARNQAIEECERISRYLKRTLRLPKVNFASIGNQVPQLHLHVVGRKPGDACWPAVVWGNLPGACPYEPTELDKTAALLTEQHGLTIVAQPGRPD